MKKMFILFDLVLLTLAAYQAGGLMYRQIGLEAKGLKETISEGDGQNRYKKSNRVSTPKTPNRLDTINTRNIFNVQVRKTKQPANAKNTKQAGPQLKKTELKLALAGTVAGGSNEVSFAVIEDKKVKTQSLYQVGNTVQTARIKQIFRNKVILTLNGEDQILVGDETQLPETTIGPANHTITGNKPPGKPSKDRLPLKEQVRLRPYYENGQPIGLTLYEMKPGAKFLKIGLQNGDIIQRINGNKILLEEDAQVLYETVESSVNLQFDIIRHGEKKKIIYDAKSAD